MATTRRPLIMLLIGFVFLTFSVDSATKTAFMRSLIDTTNRKVFDITAEGAKPEAGSGDQGRALKELPGGGDPNSPRRGGKKKKNGKNPDGNNSNGMAIIRTWVAACRGKYKGPAKVVIPKGTFVAGPILFQGPCTSSKDIVVDIQGELKGSTVLSDYSEPEWIQFEDIDGLIVTGDGIVNGQGEKTWNGPGCDNCPRAPSNLKFIKVKNALIERITSLNPKFFHYHITECNNITIDRVRITAPDESPNTDGCHISESKNIKVINSVIGTGDDCVSVGQGSRQITINNITCGPGHGISVGSLGKYKNEEPVVGVTVTNCKLSNTDNGARIKTYAGKNRGEASGIVYDNLTLVNVRNPIIIDQHYGDKKRGGGDLKDKNDPNSGSNSPYKLRNIQFKNIKGTASQNPIMKFACSGTNPCEGVQLENIDIVLAKTAKKTRNTYVTGCWHAKITPKGTINPPAPIC